MNEPQSSKDILKARARALAVPIDREADKGKTIDVIEFRLAHERYALEHGFIREVVPLKELTPLPGTPPFIAGIMNLRGQILPLLDIKKFFDLPEMGITDLHMVIIVDWADVQLGILADSVVGVSTISLDAIQSSLPTLTGIREQYLKGVTGDHLVILDVSKMLGDPKIIVDEEVNF